jgi:O-acetyl-ADP-ribose deacetylase (regulator of RNase III)
MVSVVFVSTDPVWCQFLRTHIPPQLLSVSVQNAKIDSVLHLCSLDRPSAVVTPANSLGYMGGGFDRLILECIGSDKNLEHKIQALLAESHRGYLPISSAKIVDLAHIVQGPRFDFLIPAPSMTVPEPIAPSHAKQHIFDTIWNALVAAKNAPRAISTVIIPAFGTNWGQVHPQVSAASTLAATAIFNWPLYDMGPRQSGLLRSSLALMYLRKDISKFGVPDHIKELEELRQHSQAEPLREWLYTL